MEVAVCRSLVVQLLPLLFQLLMEHSRIQQRGTPSRHFRSCRHNSSLGPPSVSPQGLQTTLVSNSSAKVSADNNSDTSTTPSVINVETAGGTGKEEHDSSDLEELEDRLSLLDELEANQFEDFDSRTKEASWRNNLLWQRASHQQSRKKS